MYRHFYTPRLLFATMCFISSCLSLNAQGGQPDSQQKITEHTGANYSNTPEASSTTRDSNIPAYRYYMLEITEVRDPYTEMFPTLQFSEFDLLDGTRNEFEGLNAYAGTNVKNSNPWGEEDINESWRNICDNNLETKYCNIEFNGRAFFMVDAGQKIDIHGYRIYTANDAVKYPNRNPKNWKLYGSNTYTKNPDNAVWQIIDERQDYSLGASNYTPHNFILNEHGYRYFMLDISDVQYKVEVPHTLQFAEFDLLDGTHNEFEGLSAYAGTGIGVEDWPSASDGKLSTKYCNTNFDGRTYFMLDAGREIGIGGYRIYTADDSAEYPNRNPKTWKLYGSNTTTTNPNDGVWELIDERWDDYTLEATNFTPYDFKTNWYNYRYFMLEITDVQDYYAEIFPTLQFAEFRLMNYWGEEIEGINLYAGTSINVKEDWSKACDNNLTTKYCCTFDGRAFIMMDAGRELDIQGYRIYTADDAAKYPFRNPKNWKLYGSKTITTNPNDAIWKLIDERQNDYTLGAANYTGYDFMQPDPWVTLDENATTVPQASNGETKILVKRTIKANEWSTICLPFDMTTEQMYEVFGEDIKLGKFVGYEASSDLTSVNVIFDLIMLDKEGFMANYPYLIKTSKDISEFMVTSTIVPNENVAYEEFTNGWPGAGKKVYGTFYGTLHAGGKIPVNGIYVNNNIFCFSAGQTTIKAFHGYFVFTELQESVGNLSNVEFRFQLNDPTTGVEYIEQDENTSNSPIYDLSGRRVSGMKRKGIYIVNGKKVLK